MALLQVFKGLESELSKVPLHIGYAYFCEDTGNFFIDVDDDPYSKNSRVQLNAYAARYLYKENGKIIDTDNILSIDEALDVSHGGTGADNFEDARENLSVYSKSEIDENHTTKVYTTTLTAGGWLEDSGKFVYNYYNEDIRCGKNGDIPPIIGCTSNKKDYNNITEAIANPGSGIVFSTEVNPTENIGIVILEV